MKFSETNEPPSGPQSSMLLALIAGLGSTLLTGLVFLGNSRAAASLDLFPCLIAAALTPLLVQTAGQLSGRKSAWISALFAFAGVALGKWLAWDLSGYVAAMSGDGSSANESWTSIVQDHWQGMPVAFQWLNAAAYLLTPIVAGLLFPTSLRFFRQCPAKASAPAIVDREVGDFRPRGWLKGLTIVWVFGVIAAHLAFGGSGQTGFLCITLPVVPANQSNTLWGFAYLIDGTPVMAEEIPAIEQAVWFCGDVRSDSNFRFLRAGYAWMAVTVFPWLNAANSLLALNLCAWLICLVCVWRLTATFYRDDVACALATMLAAAGIGFALHWQSTTPHLVSFALYAAGLTILVESRIMSQQRDWCFHLAFGTFLGLVGLVYNVWMMLALVYVVAAIRQQRVLHLVSGLVVATAFVSMWRTILPGLGINILDVEGGYLRRALGLWMDAARSGVSTFVLQLAGAVIESLTAMESPILLLLGAIGLCWTIEPGKRLFVLAAIAAPVLACTLFSPVATARGYIVYGSSCLWFMAAGRLLSMMLRAPHSRRWLGVLVATIAFASQLAWSWALVAGYPGPAFTYLYGWDDGAALVTHRMPEVASLTDQDAVPVLYGGSGTPDAVHVHRVPALVPVIQRSRVLSYLSRLIFVMGICLILSAIGERRSRRTAYVLGAILFSIVTTEVSLVLPGERPAFWEMQQALLLEPGESVTVHIDVSADARSALMEHLRLPSAVASIYLPASENCTASWAIDGERVPLGAVQRQEAAVLGDLHPSGDSSTSRWNIALTNSGDRSLSISGWQTLETPGKSQSGDDAICLPAVEFRVRDSETGRLLWLGF